MAQHVDFYVCYSRSVHSRHRTHHSRALAVMGKLHKETGMRP